MDRPRFTETKSLAKTKQAFAEVIESSLYSLLAQVWHHNEPPRFGSIVQIKQEETTVFGCVTQITTGSLDPMRYPFPYQKTEAELKAEQPQIFEFLKTTFHVHIIGYKEAGTFYHLLAHKPCKIHAFIEQPTIHDLKAFFQTPHFLYLLFSSPQQHTPLDELLLALIKNMVHDTILTDSFLEDFCHTFSLLTGNDYRRLKLFLQRLESILHTKKKNM